MEATLHLDILSLFWNIWCNPQTKSHEVLKYLLRMAENNSLTWSAHVRLVFQIYKLPDPILLLETRNRILPELLNTVANFYEGNKILSSPSHDLLTQFILDCSSLNLPPTIRVHPSHLRFTKITMQCSSLIYAIHRDRTRQLKAMGLLR